MAEVRAQILRQKQVVRKACATQALEAIMTGTEKEVPCVANNAAGGSYGEA